MSPPLERHRHLRAGRPAGQGGRRHPRLPAHVLGLADRALLRHQLSPRDYGRLAAGRSRRPISAQKRDGLSGPAARDSRASPRDSRDAARRALPAALRRPGARIARPRGAGRHPAADAGGERYTVGVAAYHVTNQFTYVAGFLVGGLVVVATGPRLTFAIDAATFLVSALIVARLGAYAPAEPERAAKARLRDRVRTITARPRLRWLAMLAMLAAFSMTPLALAVPYGRQIGLDEDLSSLLMAAIPAGYVAGTFVLTRRVRPQARPRLLGPMALASFLPLMGAALVPPLPVMLALLVVCGALTAYQVVANAEFVALVPDEQRGGAIGVVAATLTAVQGLAMVVAGVVAEFAGAGGAIAIFGASGALAALLLLRAAGSRAEVLAG
ncbi:MFS transporter [Nonomuraea recticatena]|uniref:MFS transporter n=1 Tax=Nonomuraea recticatena TaxID=46178 RepID=UPI003617B0F2